MLRLLVKPAGDTVRQRAGKRRVHHASGTQWCMRHETMPYALHHREQAGFAKVSARCLTVTATVESLLIFPALQASVSSSSCFSSSRRSIAVIDSKAVCHGVILLLKRAAMLLGASCCFIVFILCQDCEEVRTTLERAWTKQRGRTKKDRYLKDHL